MPGAGAGAIQGKSDGTQAISYDNISYQVFGKYLVGVTVLCTYVQSTHI